MAGGRNVLHWVLENHRPRGGGRRVGECLGEIADDLRERQAIWAAVSGFTDEEFGRECRLGRITPQEVEILVLSAGACTAMRLRWLTVLQDRLTRRCPEFRGRRLAFRVLEAAGAVERPGEVGGR